MHINAYEWLQRGLFLLGTVLRPFPHSLKIAYEVSTLDTSTGKIKTWSSRDIHQFGCFQTQLTVDLGLM